MGVDYYWAFTPAADGSFTSHKIRDAVLWVEHCILKDQLRLLSQFPKIQFPAAVGSFETRKSSMAASIS